MSLYLFINSPIALASVPARESTSIDPLSRLAKIFSQPGGKSRKSQAASVITGQQQSSRSGNSPRASMQTWWRLSRREEMATSGPASTSTGFTYFFQNLQSNGDSCSGRWARFLRSRSTPTPGTRRKLCVVSFPPINNPARQLEPIAKEFVPACGNAAAGALPDSPALGL